ncbi:MAG: hypothetical protein P1V18_00970 [Candidatus Gracilibacteria bacterium]|nr:hypothetical protein [Candidatus Gracilibacteria bacterium]
MKKFFISVLSLVVLTACTTANTTIPEVSTGDRFPQVISNESCSCSYTVPDTWVESNKLYANAISGAESPNTNEFAMLFRSSVEENFSVSLEEYAAEVMERIRYSSDQVTNADKEELMIEGNTALQFRMDTIINDQKSSNIFTFVQHNGFFYHFLVWSDTEIFSETSPALFKISNSLSFLSSI